MFVGMIPPIGNGKVFRILSFVDVEISPHNILAFSNPETWPERKDVCVFF